ncbi:MAG: flagellar motor switch protein FliN [Thermodesulfobacteria bacterium]|nr:flagellar motor switch protein FliN [Thermodesulfobacteriota bacterium]
MLEENKEGVEPEVQETPQEGEPQEGEKTDETQAEAPQGTEEATAAEDSSAASGDSSGGEEGSEEMSPDDLMALWEEALKEAQGADSSKEESAPTQESSSTPAPSSAQKESVPTQPANLQELTPSQETGIHPELDFILDIPLEVTVEIGRTKMMIRELLKLNQGSIIELEKFVGEPVEVLVNGKLMAKGEVVVVNDRFGVRITEIISAKERIKKLGS